MDSSAQCTRIQTGTGAAEVNDGSVGIGDEALDGIDVDVHSVHDRPPNFRGIVATK